MDAYEGGDVDNHIRTHGDSRLPARFWAKCVVDDNGCWIWTAAKNRGGYGRFGNGNGKVVRCHRLTFEALVGPIPDGLEIDHLCRVRACCNPAHLEPVTRRTNALRGLTIPAAHIKKTHCPQGHEYAGDNLIWEHRGTRRRCRQCRDARNRARVAIRRAGG